MLEIFDTAMEGDDFLGDGELLYEHSAAFESISPCRNDEEFDFVREQGGFAGRNNTPVYD